MATITKIALGLFLSLVGIGMILAVFSPEFNKHWLVLVVGGYFVMAIGGVILQDTYKAWRAWREKRNKRRTKSYRRLNSW